MFTLINIANVYTRNNTYNNYIETDSRGTDTKILKIVLICSNNAYSMQAYLSLTLVKYYRRIFTVPLECKI